MDLKELKSKASLLELALIDTVEHAVRRDCIDQVLDQFIKQTRHEPPPGRLDIVREPMLGHDWMRNIETQLRKHFNLT